MAGSSRSSATSPLKPIEIVPASVGRRRQRTASAGAVGSSSRDLGHDRHRDRWLAARPQPARLPVAAPRAWPRRAPPPFPFPLPLPADQRPRARSSRSRSAPKASGPIRTASSQACTASQSSCAPSSRWSTRPVTSTTASSVQALAVSAKSLGKTTTSVLPCRSSTVATSMVEPARVTIRRVDWMIPPTVTLAWSDSSARSPV